MHAKSPQERRIESRRRLKKQESREVRWLDLVNGNVDGYARTNSHEMTFLVLHVSE
jgi:hypothetical protein